MLFAGKNLLMLVNDGNEVECDEERMDAGLVAGFSLRIGNLCILGGASWV